MAHVHAYSRRRKTSSVETCPCGAFRFTEHAGPPIVGKPHDAHEWVYYSGALGYETLKCRVCGVDKNDTAR